MSPLFERIGPVAVWWRGLSPRERLLMRVLIALAAAVAVVFLIVKPIQGARARALADIRTYETLSQRLTQAGPNLRPQAPQRTGAPAEIAASSAANLSLALRGTEPQGVGVVAAVEAAPFDTVLRWIADVEATSPLRVRDLDLVAGSAPGLVTGRVVLAP